jgi:hypothetical protein
MLDPEEKGTKEDTAEMDTMAEHFGSNNVEQQLLSLILTACRGHSGVNKSPFRASQVVRGMPERSRYLRV